jgi:SAM-dependent MidA family methyltransferase
MRRFRLDDQPLTRIGEKDMTAHVDFGNVRRCGWEAGFAGGDSCSLRVFLISSGVDVTAARSAAEQLALRHLLVSEIGDAHQVMLLTRGLPPDEPSFGRRRLDRVVERGRPLL